VTRLLIAVTVTTATEALVYRGLICPRAGRALLASAAINLITVAPANLAYGSLLRSGTMPIVAFGLIEALVILVEVLLIRTVIGVRWMPSVMASVAANACSMALSALM
jgi:hypothetical protein